jgi:hypothetical protein
MLTRRRASDKAPPPPSCHNLALCVYQLIEAGSGWCRSDSGRIPFPTFIRKRKIFLARNSPVSPGILLW